MHVSGADTRVMDRPAQIAPVDRVLVCYLSGLDRRWLTPDITPAISGLLAEYPSAAVVGFPNTELASTIMSGAYPHRHGLWQVALDPHPRSPWFSRLADRLPDLVTTTAQCAIHVVRPSFDLAGVPYRRRRRLRQTRFKYYMRADKALTPESEFPRQVGASQTLFGSLPPAAARYRLSTNLRLLPAVLLLPLFAGGERLEFLEIRGIDIFEHWHLDDPAAMGMAYRLADRFVADLTRCCDQAGALLLLVSDHGQEVVRRQIDLAGRVRSLGLTHEEYDMFLEVPSARFWFHTERARERIGGLLSGLGGSVLGWRDLSQFGIEFPDQSQGELYWVADPGTVIFPHDFHHPIGNLAMAASDWQQRPRLSSPVHRGYHAYMPHHPCEQGFVVVRDRDRKLWDTPLRLVDVAPTVLHLLGLPPAEHMPGRSAVVG
jgi:type I phosphodiesterase/nucleotide pyrophosphatase